MTFFYRSIITLFCSLLAYGCSEDSSPTGSESQYPTADVYSGKCGMNSTAFIVDTNVVANVSFAKDGQPLGWPITRGISPNTYSYTRIQLSMKSEEAIEAIPGKGPERLAVDIELRVPGVQTGEFPWVPRTSIDTSSATVKFIYSNGSQEYIKFVEGKTILTQNEPDPFGDLNLVKGAFTGVFETLDGKYFAVDGKFGSEDCR